VDFIIKNKTIIAFISFTLFCIISLSVQSSLFTLSFEDAVGMFLMPFQKLYHNVQKGANIFWAGFTELGDLREELQRVRKKVQTYDNINDEFIVLKKENIRLRQILNLQDRISYDSFPATIISKDPDNWFRTIIINRGDNSCGIRKNMPVISFYEEEKIVFGKVIEVKGSVSRILPIISKDMKLGVMFQESHIPGLLTGSSLNSDLCIMDFISNSAKICFGDIIVTSGMGGIFPPGIQVGTVVKFFVIESKAFQRAIIKPIIDYSKIEEVFVINKEIDKELLELFKKEE